MVLARDRDDLAGRLVAAGVVGSNMGGARIAIDATSIFVPGEEEMGLSIGKTLFLGAVERDRAAASGSEFVVHASIIAHDERKWRHHFDTLLQSNI